MVQVQILEIGNVIMGGESGSDPFQKNSLLICKPYVRCLAADGHEAPEYAVHVPPADTEMLR